MSGNTAALRELTRFIGVGAMSTALYAAIAYGLVYGEILRPIGANHVALLISGTWSYLGQRYLTFGYTGGHRQPATRFAIQMAAIYVASNTIYLLADQLGIDSLFAVATVVITVPVCNYLVMKFWVFR